MTSFVIFQKNRIFQTYILAIQLHSDGETIYNMLITDHNWPKNIKIVLKTWISNFIKNKIVLHLRHCEGQERFGTYFLNTIVDLPELKTPYESKVDETDDEESDE